MTQTIRSLWTNAVKQLQRAALSLSLVASPVPATLGFGVAAAFATAHTAQADGHHDLGSKLFGNENNHRDDNHGYYGNGQGYYNGWQGQPYYAPPPVIVVPQPQPYCDTGYSAQIVGYDQWGHAVTYPPLPPQYRVTINGEIYGPCGS